MGARDDPLRGHETPQGARGRRARHPAQGGAREAGLPQCRTHPPDPRPLDGQVQGTPGLGTHRPQEHARRKRHGDEEMEPQKDRLTYVHQIYIRATPQAIWDAITDPQWNGKYGYQAVSEYELKPGGKYRVQANAAMKGFGLPDTILDGEVDRKSVV